MEKNKKSQRWGGEGWRPIVCVMPKSNGKQAPPLSFAITPTVTREARHSPPSPLRKKSRFAKKKSASPKKNRAYHFSKSRIHQRGEPRLTFFSKSRIYRIYQIAARGKPPSEMAYCGHASEAKPSEAWRPPKPKRRASRGSVVASHHRWGHATL